MPWVTLVVAGLCEIGWAIGLRYTEGFTRPWPTVWTVLSIITSHWLLGIAMKSLPVGTEYSVCVGVGRQHGDAVNDASPRVIAHRVVLHRALPRTCLRVSTLSGR